MKQGWQLATLNDLCIVDWGNTNLTKSAYIDGGEFLAVSAAGCDGRIGHKEHSKHTPVLSAIGAQCGKMFFPEEDFTAIKNTITLTPREGRCGGRFLYYLLTFVELPQRGAGQPFISKGDIQSFAVAFPPLPEQQRIVGILDEAFDGIAVARASAEQNLQNVRALFESHLQSVFTQRGEGWSVKPLGNVCNFSQGVQVDVKLQSETRKDENQVRFLRIVDFTKRDEAERYIENPGTKFLVSASDISLVRYGASTGFVCRGLDGAIANNLFRVIPKEGGISNDYLYWYLKSTSFQDEIKKIMNGAAMPAISFSVINNIPFPFPKMAEQLPIADRLDLFAEETQRLESLYQRKLAALDELKKSLLHQAFSGAL